MAEELYVPWNNQGELSDFYLEQDHEESAYLQQHNRLLL